MATHSSVLAWRIPGTGEPGGLPSVRSQRVQSRTRLKRLSSSSSSRFHKKPPKVMLFPSFTEGSGVCDIVTASRVRIWTVGV